MSLEEINVEELDVIVDDAGKDLHKTLQNITTLCKNMPELPSKAHCRNIKLLLTDINLVERYLSMNLFLLPHDESSTSIDGFSMTHRESTVWPHHDEWARQTEAFNTLSASIIRYEENLE